MARIRGCGALPVLSRESRPAAVVPYASQSRGKGYCAVSSLLRRLGVMTSETLVGVMTCEAFGGVGVGAG